jgi:PAS domain S-box-containing protein
MGALIRAYDWAASPIGPPSAWPQGLKTALRLVLSSRHAMLIWWGPELIQFYNDSYCRLIGPENHPSALGQGGADCWPQVWDIIGPQIDYVMGGRGATWHENQMLPVIRNGRRDEAYWTYGYSPIDEAGVTGGVGGVLAVCAETTHMVQAAIALRHGHARQEFWIALEDALRGLTTPLDIMAVAAERLGRHLGVDRSSYYTVADDHVTVEGECRTDGTPSLIGRHWLGSQAGRVLSPARAGAALRVDDTAMTESAGDFAAFGMAAILSAPVFRGGRWVAGLHVHQRTPRAWADDEVALSREVAERVWSAIERTLARAALAASEARYRALVTGTGPIVFRTAPDGNMIEAPGWEGRTGQDLGGYKGLGWLDVVHPDDRSRMVTQWTASLASGEPIHLEYRTRTPEGHWRWADGYAVPVRAPDGTIIEWVGTVTDIDDRRTAEDALRESEARFRHLAETIEEVFYINDIDAMRLVYLSPAFEKTWGRPVEWLKEDVGRLIGTVHPDDRAALEDVRQARIEGKAGEVTFRITRPDGSERWIFDRTFPIRVDGRRWSAGLAEDITDRKQAETALRTLNETLEQRVANEVAERSKAEDALRQAQKLEAIGQLTGGVAHDFNNLLTVIQSATDLLRRRDLTEERRQRYIDTISDTTERAAKLTSQLLAFSRRQALSPSVFDLAERLSGITEMLKTVVGQRVVIALDIAEAPALVEADANQFETALINLAANARDAMDGQGNFTIRLFQAARLPKTVIWPEWAKPENYIAVSVRDTGCGINAACHERIFEPFFTTKAVGRGTGLGLSQVYGFARQSGGEVMVDSIPGEGATFTLYLPRTTKPLSAIKTTGEDSRAAQPAEGCVLLVEDNRDVGEFSTQLLQSLGYETLLAASGEEALSILAENSCRFDVVFSDIVMPGMGGIALGQEIRRRLPDLPIVLTTGFSSDLVEDHAHGFDVLPKPYSAESLSRILSRARKPA